MRSPRTIVRLAFVAALVAPLPGIHAVAAREFDPRVVTFGDARTEIKSKPMTQRPNRPLHVYGNTVRRRAHRGGS